MSNPSRRRYTAAMLAFQVTGVIIGMVIGIVLVPIYLQYISVASYGLWLATGSVLMWISLVDPGLGIIVQQSAAEAYGRQDMVRVGAICGTGILMNLALVALFVALALVMGWHLSLLVEAPDPATAAELRQAFILAALGAAMNLLSYVFRCSNQALHAAVAVGTIDLVARGSGVAVVLFAFRHGFGLRSFGILTLWTGCISAFGNAGCLFYLARRERLRFTLSQAEVKLLIGKVSFNFMGRLAYVLQGFDMAVVNKLLGPEITAIYGLTRRAPDVLRPFISLPIDAASPSLAHLLGEGDIEKLRRVVSRLVSISLWLIGLAAAGCITLNANFIHLWIGDGIYPGNLVNMLVCFQFTTFMVVSAFSSLCFYLGDVKKLSVVMVARSVLLITLTVIGARIGGLVGVAAGGWIAMIALVGYPLRSTIRLACFTAQSRRTLAREALAVGVAGGVAAGVVMLLQTSTWVAFSMAALLLTALYLCLLIGLSPELRGVGQQAWNKVLEYRRS